MSQSRAVRAAGLAISVASLLGVVLWAASQPAPGLPAGAGELLALAGAVGVYGIATGLRAWRWGLLLRAEGGRPSFADSLALTAVGFMGNNVLPVRAGDAMRVYLMAPRSGLRMRDVAGTLIAERVLDVFVLLALFGFLAYGLLSGIETPGGTDLATGLAIAAAALGIAIVAVLLLRRGARGRRLIDLARPLVAPTSRLRGAAGITMAAVTIAIWATEACCYVLVAESVGVGLGLVEALYVIAVAGVFLLIPSGPGYAGTLDAAVLFGLEAVGESGAEALSFLIMLRFALFVPITLAGLALVIGRYGGLAALRSRQEAEAGA